LGVFYKEKVGTSDRRLQAAEVQRFACEIRRLSWYGMTLKKKKKANTNFLKSLPVTHDLWFLRRRKLRYRELR
jgi:hypothetical protein